MVLLHFNLISGIFPFPRCASFAALVIKSILITVKVECDFSLQNDERYHYYKLALVGYIFNTNDTTLNEIFIQGMISKSKL